MDEQGFIGYLRRRNRSQNTIRNCLELVSTFESYLLECKQGRTLESVQPQDIEDFVRWGEDHLKSLHTHLLALCHYYEYTANEPMCKVAAKLREPRLRRASIPLKKLPGIAQEHIERLAAIGITRTRDVLLAGRTRSGRRELAEKTGIPLGRIVELVKLADLARIPGVKKVRARLYYEAGVDTIEKLAAWDPEALRDMLIEFVQVNEFEGTAPWPQEARTAVTTAQRLSQFVEY